MIMFVINSTRTTCKIIAQSYKKIFKLALKIEGLPRQRGIHPSGIVINQERLDERLPMFYDEQTKI